MYRLGVRVLISGVLLAAAPAMGDDSSQSTLDRTLQMLDLSGDLRLRQELDLTRRDAADEELPFRQRPRLRLRVGLRFTPGDEFTIGLRVVSGNAADPKSTHQTLGAGNTRFEISLDRIYLRYAPSWAPGLVLTGGKLPHPFAGSAVYSVLMFDDDVQPTGATLSWRSKALGPVKVSVSVAEYFLVEQSNAGDLHSTAAQLALDVDLGSSLALKVAGETYIYWDPTADGDTTLVQQNAGNATTDGDGDGTADGFASDFQLIQAFATLKWSGSVPIAATGGILKNLGAVDGEDSMGWFAGLRAGKTKKAMGWKVYAQYQVVPAESIFSPFSQDDFLVATGFTGVVGGVGFQALDWLNLHLWAIAASRREVTGSDDPGGWQTRVRLDLNAKF